MSAAAQRAVLATSPEVAAAAALTNLPHHWLLQPLPLPFLQQSLVL
jgi:hypothetical protein